jgi:3-hydroxyisobutyrate dehydrogenase
MSVAFLGLGRMGEPMATNLLRSGMELVVWNRSAAPVARLVALGAQSACSARVALAGCSMALLMLANEQVINEVLERGSSAFEENVSGKTIVNMGTVSPAFSRALASDVTEAGGRYVEAPVSGSRIPAEQGVLVGMVAGDEPEVGAVRTLVAPMCKDTFACGPVPNALTMKLAVNLFLITMVTGLAEAAHFARQSGLDLSLFRSIVGAGSMSSDVSRIKLAKLVEGNLLPQASLSDVLMNSRLISEAARAGSVATPLIEQCYRLFADADARGFGSRDMIGITGAFEALTSELRGKVAECG